MSLLGLAALLVTLAYKYVLQPMFLSPLGKLPAPHPLCHLSTRWLAHQRDRGAGETIAIQAAHVRLGPLLRIAPHEVSVNSLQGLRHIYTAGLEKHEWYRTKFENFGTPNLVASLDHASHSVQKRMLTRVYAKSYIQHSPVMAQLSADIVGRRLLPVLRLHGGAEGDAVDVMALFQFFGMDFMTAYLFGFGHGTDFLNDRAAREAYFDEWDKIRTLDDPGEKQVTEGMCMKMVEASLARAGAGGPAADDPIVSTQMHTRLQAAAEAGKAPLDPTALKKRVASEMFDHMIASHETTAITMTYAMYRLSQDPALQAELRAELRTLDPIIGSGAGAGADDKTNTAARLPPVEQLDALPLLHAVLQETLRLHTPTPARQRRVVPAAGIVLHGYAIPAGTTVSCSAYSLHRHEDAFPRAAEWLPQRWMREADEGAQAGFPDVEVARKYFWSFGSGGRMWVAPSPLFVIVWIGLAD